jgi:hypothetical protein
MLFCSPIKGEKIVDRLANALFLDVFLRPPDRAGSLTVGTALVVPIRFR